ncbi:Nudix family hydrolase [Marinimicrobium sp. ABcell2]|uniref:Nudix family hydrolase n=1 Tax=Marinimicrobium sp. ABcell2 TaxID=3069751 RepID=UPI0027AEAA14|nr:Nudix family hydrolase [Marinimicrobium sp. ABcell2]MDQ2075097.1 Nudix family hydrolase [Marinimicrobium sp. ABcell2]
MPTTEAKAVVHVAVGVLEDELGRVLIARRPDHVHQGGLWEFPGGKVDPGETLDLALRRELWEELGIQVQATEPLIQIRHHYPDKSVLLDVHKITRFEGEPHGNEGQPVQWVKPHRLREYRFPAANVPIISALNLPDRMLITGAAATADEFMLKAERALASGIRLIQLRCPGVSETEYEALARPLAAMCQEREATLMCNTQVEHWQRLRLGGLHLNSRQLRTCTARPVPDSVLLGASCHNPQEIEQACALGADYLTVSPVAPTATHPDAPPLGWDRFAEWVEQARVPVYALGGMTPAEITQARRLGAQGIAGIGFGWKAQ